MLAIQYCFIGFILGIIINWIGVALVLYIDNKKREESIFYIPPKDKD